jgi:hypothetical protein
MWGERVTAGAKREAMSVTSVIVRDLWMCVVSVLRRISVVPCGGRVMRGVCGLRVLWANGME